MLHELTPAAVDVSANATRTLIAAPGAGNKILVHEVYLRFSATGTIKLQDSTPTALTGTMPVNQYDEIHLIDVDNPLFTCASNTSFQAVISAGPEVDGYVRYRTIHE